MKILKMIALLVAAVIFALVIVPLCITAIFSPETETTPTKKSQDKTPAVSINRVTPPSKIKVYRKSKGKTETVSFETYVKGVAASEMPSNFEPEALKAQAVAARTYSLAKLNNAKTGGNPSEHPGAPVCDTVHCQVYQSKKELREVKGNTWMKSDWPKVSAAVDSTKGQLIYYDGKLIEQALFHSSSGGKTENSEDVFAAAVPYLVSVDSPYEKEATHSGEKVTMSISKFSNKIKSYYPGKTFGKITASNIKILNHSGGGRVDRMQIGKGTLEGRQIREALGLYSANFTIKLAGNKITFTTKGSGHGVGMSQYGANGMAKNGSTYKEILTHYYSGTVIE